MLFIKSWLIAFVTFLLCIDYVFAATGEGFDNSLGLRINYYREKNNANQTPNPKRPKKKPRPSYEMISYGTILEYDGDTKDLFNDDELFGLAYQAYQEMRELHKETSQKCDSSQGLLKLPTIISALALGNKIYISSGLRGEKAASFVYLDYPDRYLEEKLNQCHQSLVADAQESGSNVQVSNQHRHKGACAEIVTILTFYEYNHQTPSSLKLPAPIGRMASWGSFGRNEDQYGGYAVAPCDQNGPDPDNNGSPSNSLFGCAHFLEFEGLAEPADARKRYDDSKRGKKQYVGSQSSWPKPPSTDKRPIANLDVGIQINIKDPEQIKNPGD